MQVENIIIYLRKSRKDYEFYNEPIEKTLKRHETMLQDFACKTYGKKIPEKNIFREVVSGDTIADRPQMQKVMSLIEDDKYKAVLVLEIERLARGNTIDQGIIAQTFEFTDTLIITPQKTFNLHNELDKSFFEDGLYQSRKYLLYTKKILARGREQSSREGKYVASILPFGYNKEKLKNEKGYKLVIDEEEAEIVKLIFKLYTENIGTQAIANHLNKINVKAKVKSYWNANMVRNILKNVIYIGKIKWNYRKEVQKVVNGIVIKSRPVNNDYILVDGLHKSIIDIATWNKVQELMKQRKRQKPPTEIKSPLAGLVYCKMCNEKMVRRPYTNKYPDTLMCRNKICKCVSSDLKIVENKVIESLKKILINYQEIYIDKVSKEDIVNYETIKDNLKKEIDNYKVQLEKIYSLFENGIYNNEEFSTRRTQIKEKILKNEKAILEVEKEEKNNSVDNYLKLIPKIKEVLEIYSGVDVKQKNELLKSIVSKIYYSKEKNGRWDKEAINNFSIEIYMKL